MEEHPGTQVASTTAKAGLRHPDNSDQAFVQLRLKPAPPTDATKEPQPA